MIVILSALLIMILAFYLWWSKLCNNKTVPRNLLLLFQRVSSPLCLEKSMRTFATKSNFMICSDGKIMQPLTRSFVFLCSVALIYDTTSPTIHTFLDYIRMKYFRLRVAIFAAYFLRSNAHLRCIFISAYFSAVPDIIPLTDGQNMNHRHSSTFLRNFPLIHTSSSSIYN
jgi:hypothetical protein